MVEFVYNNAKNISIGHIPFELIYGYHSCILNKKAIDPRSNSKSADKLLMEF